MSLQPAIKRGPGSIELPRSADVEAFETQPLAERALPRSTYASVGKIFKPALQQLAMEAVVGVEAVTARAAIISLARQRNEQGAHLLRARSHGDTAALQSALERYAFISEVLESGGADLGKAAGCPA